MGLYVRFGKRVIDAVVASVALLLLSPILLAAAVAVRATMGSPVLFRHRRPGLHGRQFTLYKFRSMANALGPTGEPLPDGERLTRAGRLLRSSSIDELPELLNVIRGDMSLVGPRPLLTEYLPLYNQRQARRHEVRPGITGWAQVNGRNAISWEQKLEYDAWYVDHRSFWLDVRIVLLTVLKVLSREGITQLGQATVQPFSGGPLQNPNGTTRSGS
jgi:lipopolysaccharide/colanic/teichoic acid biosynthesis glycosyltransferase